MPILIDTGPAAIVGVWLAAVSLCLVAPHYSARLRIPWPLVAVLFLVVLAFATLLTALVLQGRWA